jgi:SlyX protein
MTPDELDRRLADLEIRVAFQEQTLLELSDALAAARDEEGRTALLLHRALEELKAIRSTLSAAPATGDASLEPPPPHY